MDVRKQLEGLSELVRLVAISNFKREDEAFDYLVSAAAYINMSTNFEKPSDATIDNIKNVSEFGKKCKYIIANNVDGELWYYGADNNRDKANYIATRIDNGVVFENSNVQN